MGNNDKHFWGSREQRKSFWYQESLKQFREQGIKSKKIKGSREHVTPSLGRAQLSLPVFKLILSTGEVELNDIIVVVWRQIK